VNFLATPINWWATGLFGTVCFLIGLAVSLMAIRRWQVTETSPAEDVLDDDASSYFDSVAAEWAQRSGRPADHADIAASYLKLAARLHGRLSGAPR
jgi:hypothetical protein